MTIFYDDQLTVGNSWAWYLSAAPMLSNVLYSKWCATVGPALYSICKESEGASKVYYLGLAIGATLCGVIQLVMKHQMEKHFVPEQPVYIEVMREHHDVSWVFLIAVYALLAGVAAYAAYDFTTKRRKNAEEHKEEGSEVTDLKFVEVFIHEKSKNFNKLFGGFYQLRQKMTEEYGKSFWDDLMNEYLHALKITDIGLEEFTCQYECYHRREESEKALQIAEYKAIGSLYYETRGESKMTAVEYLTAKAEHAYNEAEFIQDFKRWIWTWGQDLPDQKHWKEWTE